MKKGLLLVACLLVNGSLLTSHAQVVTEIDCSKSLCGCWRDATLAYENVVVDELSGLPVSGILLKFRSADEPVAVSDEYGVISFEMDLRSSPGCKYGPFNHVVFVDSTGMYRSVERSVFQRQKVELERNGAE